MWGHHLQDSFTIQKFWLILAGILFRPAELGRGRWKSTPEIIGIAPIAAPRIELLPAVETLCSRCRFDENKYPATHAAKSKSGSVNKSIRILKEGAVWGCWLCQALLSATKLWKEYDASALDRMLDFKVRYDIERFTIRGQTCFPVVQIYCPQGITCLDARQEHHTIRLTASLIGKPQALRLISDKEVPTTALSQSSSNFVTSNLRNCLENHIACHESQAGLSGTLGGGRPKRMLRIDTLSQQVKLVTFEPSMASKYVALSYCWGCQEGHLRATSETLPRLRKGVDIGSLPRTLQDAVQVAISLKFDLIWIDSVCIIQDDPEDLNEEAGKMSTVYAQALLTIIAKSASACDEGFLSKKRQGSIHLANVRVGNKPTEVRARVVHDWGHHRGGPQSYEHHYSKWVDPVDKRAWTLQERLLSTRYVTYTSGEVQWGCKTGRDCECGKPLYGRLEEHLGPEDQWFAMLEEYSNRNLSVHTDKLTALAGIARRLSVNLKWQQYAAGIWINQQTDELSARGLVWQRSAFWREGEDVASLPSSYTAPSYSWASVVGKVIHQPVDSSKVYNYPTKVVDVITERASPDEFGRVSGGFIRFAGPLLRARLRWNKTWSYSNLKPKIKVEGVHQSFAIGCIMDVTLKVTTLEDGSAGVQRSTPPSSEAAELKADEVCEEVEVCLLPIRVYSLPKISMWPFSTFAFVSAVKVH